jgi:hypothetical protein
MILYLNPHQRNRTIYIPIGLRHMSEPYAKMYDALIYRR